MSQYTGTECVALANMLIPEKELFRQKGDPTAAGAAVGAAVDDIRKSLSEQLAGETGVGARELATLAS
jgi:hypothetical protein